MTKKLTRQDIYELFSRAGYRSPAHGLVLEIAPAIIAAAWEGRSGPSGHPLQQGPYKEPQLVVYLDEYATGGEGMVLVPAHEAMEKYSGNFCSEYLHGGDCQASLIIRQLQIGYRHWLLRYKSDCSTWGNGSAQAGAKVISEQEPGYKAELPFPIWAVDFVQVPGYGLLAVDLTLDPKTGQIETIIGNSEIGRLKDDAEQHFRGIAQ